MALTIKLINKEGILAVMDDEFGKVGSGRAVPSKSHPGLITLTLKLKNPHIDIHTNKVMINDFLVLRVPIDWLAEGDK